MSLVQVVFVIVAVCTLAAGVLVVSARKIIHSALWLIAALLGVAITFVLLEAPFFAMIQVIVYIGAIAILVIFGVMLTRRALQDDDRPLNRGWPAAALTALLLFVGLIFLVRTWPGLTQATAPQLGELDSIKELGVALVSPTQAVIPFEVASVLLLTALIGAIYIGREKS